MGCCGKNFLVIILSGGDLPNNPAWLLSRLQSVLEENYTVEYIGDVPYDTETRYVLLATKQD